jgi:hypothetical protein
MSEYNHLIGETDAQVWAKAWLKAMTEHPGIVADEGTMIGWFANAIMAGYDWGVKTEQKRPIAEKIRELVFQAAGAATGPLLQDHPDYVFPSDRVAEAVERVCAEFGVTVPKPEPAPSPLTKAEHDELAPPDRGRSAYHHPPGAWAGE